jgi:3-oxoacyl-[acyl-carrier protein] reductase
MVRQRGGRIINITSVAGLAGNAGQTNYAASKAGIIGFTKTLAKELGSRSITVNAVAPGFVPTTLTNDLPEDLKQAVIDLTPLRRFGEPEEIAAAVAFFASDEAGFITGQVLSVDGGLVMQ